MSDIATYANDCNCFLREFFGRSEGPVFFCSLGNEAGRFPTKELTTRELDKVEAFIRKWDAQGLADILAGDPAVCEVARLMRLPGSHNTKNGEWLPVEVVSNGGHTYTIEDLEAWLDSAEPVLTRQGGERKAKASERNAFEEFGEERFKTPTQELNDLALAHLSDWVPELFPEATPSNGGYRVTSAALGRELEEDLSIMPQGIKDFGVHDMGDPFEGRRTPVTLVMEHKFEVPVEVIARREADAEFQDACDWLRGRLPQQEEPAKPVVAEKVWPTLAPEALHGLAGKLVKVIGPHTESDPVALLMQFMVSFGSVLGRRPYYLIEGDRHYTNLFAVLVGQSSKSRKGTSAGRIRQVMLGVDLDWVQKCIHSGLSSGEGLIWVIRDEVTKLDKEGNEVVEVQGVDDKRLSVGQVPPTYLTK